MALETGAAHGRVVTVSFLPFGERDDEEAAAAEPGQPSTDGATGRPIDVFVETGLTPEEFVLEELLATDGPIKQQEFCRRMNLSDSTVSVLLCRMEQEGTIDRLQMGAEKIVYRPDAPPEIERSPEDLDDVE